MHHRIEQRDIGAGLELQEVIGMPGQGVAARIHQDQLGATLGGGLEKGGGDRVVLGRACANDDDAIAVFGGCEGRGDRTRPDGLHQGCHGTRVAKPGAVIDIVGAERGADQFLEEIGFLVRAFGRAEAGNRIATMFIAGFGKARSGK